MIKKSFLLLLLIATLSIQLLSASTTTIVSYTLMSSSNATGGIASNYPGQGRVINISGITSSGYSSGNGQTCYGWNSAGSDCWVTSVFSTTGYTKLGGSFEMKASSTGPRDFKIEYSLNGTSWNNVSTGTTITLTTSLVQYNFTLPVACENQSSVYLRWVQNSNNNLSGGALGSESSVNASLKNITVTSTTLSAPTTQAHHLTFLATNPTTLKVECSAGNGSYRIFKVNTSNSFSDPSDNDDPTGNSNYSGSGEQIIYNGTGTSVTITVPNVTNQYWFRVYEYNKASIYTMFNTSTASNNPIQCKLEGISSPTMNTLRLSSAHLGGTIATPLVGSVTERGVYWSTTSPVDENSNIISTQSSSGGPFTVFADALDRGTTIYYKAYVTNGSGTTMSSEASFSNVPTFSGTGTFETAARWNVSEVPGGNGSANGTTNDSPIINGSCTLTANNTVNDLIINSGKLLTINPAITLNVGGTLTNNAGVNGIRIKASSSAANGSLIFANPNNNGSVPASVEMYSKAYADTKYHWQYFGIPVQSTTIGTTFSGASFRVRWYDESNIDPTGQDIGLWKPSGPNASLSGTDVLTPVTGYEVSQRSPTTYVFKGNLFTSNINKNLNYTAIADWAGNYILSNPYTGAINIADINFGSLEAAVYIYNSGSRDEWLANGGASSPGSTPGTYAVSTGGFSGIFGIPAEIPSMQGFLVKGNSSSSLDIPYSAVITNTNQQRTPRKVKAALYPGLRIDAVSKTSTDRLWIFGGSNFTSKYDNGWDGRKLLVNGATQLYAIEDDGEYQIAAIPDINEVNIGFQAGANDTIKLIFSHQNTESSYPNLYLTDLQENQTIDISSDGAEYNFISTTTDIKNRFRISTTLTDIKNRHIQNQIFSTENAIFATNNQTINGLVLIYSISGSLIKQIEINPQQKISIPTNTFLPGVYIAKLRTNTGEITQRLIIR